MNESYIDLQESPLPEMLNAIEMEKAYQAYAASGNEGGLDLGCWLPSIRKHTRPLMPGELCFVMAEPGVGKSMVLQAVAVLSQEPCLFFEMEMPGNLMFERFQQNVHAMEGAAVLNTYESGKTLGLQGMRHIRVCDATRLNRAQMLGLIAKWRNTDDAFCVGPGLNRDDGGIVLVDYIGLMGATGKSRYERVSVAAEDLKTLAKEANVIILAATQMHRKEGGGDYEPELHDGKDSSSIEDAADLLLGLWRHSEDRDKGFVKILKNRKGISGEVIPCIVEGKYMRWREAMRCASDYGTDAELP